VKVPHCCFNLQFFYKIQFGQFLEVFICHLHLLWSDLFFYLQFLIRFFFFSIDFLRVFDMACAMVLYWIFVFLIYFLSFWLSSGFLFHLTTTSSKGVGSDPNNVYTHMWVNVKTIKFKKRKKIIIFNFNIHNLSILGGIRVLVMNLKIHHPR
jgi:hypothetical protein